MALAARGFAHVLPSLRRGGVGGDGRALARWEVEHTERSTGFFLIAADCALEQYNTNVKI